MNRTESSAFQSEILKVAGLWSGLKNVVQSDYFLPAVTTGVGIAGMATGLTALHNLRKQQRAAEEAEALYRLTSPQPEFSSSYYPEEELSTEYSPEYQQEMEQALLNAIQANASPYGENEVF